MVNRMNFKKIVKIVYEYLINHIDIIVFLSTLLLIDVLMRIFCNIPIAKMPLLFSFRWYLVLSIPLLLIKRKVRHVCEIVIVTILSIYSFAQTFHFQFFDTFFSVKKISVINELIDVSGEIISEIKLEYIIFIIPILIILFVIHKQNKAQENKYLLINVTFCIFMLIGVVSIDKMINRTFVQKDIEEGWKSDQYLFTTFHNKNRYFERFGVIQYIYGDIETFLSTSSDVSLTNEEKYEIEEFINANTIVENEMSGIFEGKNLILILAESLNTYPIIEELTPTLHKMKSEGFYFTNYHAPIYQSATGDSEFISLTSMMPSVDYGTTSYTFHNNEYPYALGHLFKEGGYHVNSYHSYISNFYNRELFHESLGFSTFYDMDKLGLDKPYHYKEALNWLDDSELFIKMLENTEMEEGAFFDYVITTSGHMPYKLVREELVDFVELIDKTDYREFDEELKCYIAAQMHLDRGLEAMINMLDEKGELEDTVIIIYGDHYPYGITSEENIDIVTDDAPYNINKVPLIIYNSETPGKEVDKLGSTFDIYPTICNLFGLDYSKSFVVGNDLFSDEEGFVLFMDRSVLTEDFYYNSATNETTILSESYSEEKQNNIFSYMNIVFDLGQKILVGNYYNSLEVNR